ncbi:2-succinyl-5-enolpyruvyl-6-hydroxy-3-cyclohexene-1-carboxylic-acid synthase [Tersicoccus phoenicis]|uniref:2-succinyl-5-enolpyruvyl-6-hydroxy-3-cyclohexene-1-carboxylate synthase n=1 Tax=Tersicoccus phoenicis TaxID=554083 RepID=A0A1R1LP09_9MICC|nr:2-succinyl-5-enolpyruvyl-6-hydroxy-3-cyclohexene-1-carboxylic-acid synthase [Tersicoccus phoenicis]OMH29288.1 2-succinyl-5-enolpyruvyl-6-hydroxy-3-cyclohexene-1-carboxylic-acid synthase [Tersicoccus phoenicis]
MTDAMTVARAVVRLLIDGGVRDVVVCPGSRSAPLAYALAEVAVPPDAVDVPPGRVRLHVRIDERAAGFTALGLARGSGLPAAVVTTSGTAVGNLMPAVMEANHSAVPLLVLSADRPEELRGTGANQTTRQFGLFGVHVRAALDVPADDPAAALDAAARVLAAAKGLDAPGESGEPARQDAALLRVAAPGPVQLNLAFRDPLVPAEEPADDPFDPSPVDVSTLVTPPNEDAGAGQSSRSAASATATRRTVVVAGDGAGREAALFAAGLGLPLLAEPSSNARHGATAVAAYRLLLPHLLETVERAVLFGRPTLSRPVAALLARREVDTALYAPTPVAWFDPGRRRERLISDPGELADFAGAGPAGWAADWQERGAHLAARLRDLAEADAREAENRETTGVNGPLLAARLWRATTGILVAGSSNPIRDLDLMAGVDGAGPDRVIANRGVAGIDGTISTASGVALGTGRPVRVLLGDITYLHDATGWYLGAGEREPDLQAVVLNDAGGAIFGLLEHGRVAGRPGWTNAIERLFGTPQRVDLSALAAAYGIRHQRVSDVDALDAALAAPIRGRSVVEVVADRTRLAGLHARFTEAAAEIVNGRPDR